MCETVPSVRILILWYYQGASMKVCRKISILKFLKIIWWDNHIGRTRIVLLPNLKTKDKGLPKDALGSLGYCGVSTWDCWDCRDFIDCETEKVSAMSQKSVPKERLLKKVSQKASCKKCTNECVPKMCPKKYKKSVPKKILLKTGSRFRCKNFNFENSWDPWKFLGIPLLGLTCQVHLI